MWRIRSACSGCAASAHAAAPPSKLMKLRRLIRSRQKRTFSSARRMSALPSKADILTQRITDPKTEIAAGYSKQHRRALAVIGWRKRYQARKVRPRSFWELVMSCYSHSERDTAFAAPRKFSFRAVLSRIADHLHRARDRPGAYRLSQERSSRRARPGNNDIRDRQPLPLKRQQNGS